MHSHPSYQPFEVPGNRPAGWTSAAVSLLLHLGVLVLLIWLIRAAPIPGSKDQVRSVDLVLAAATPDNQTQYLDELPPTTDAPNESIADLLPTQSLPAESKLDSTSPPAADAGNSVPDAGAMTRVSEPGVTGAKRALSQADLEAIAQEQRMLAAQLPRGEPATLSVFGSGGLTGRKFVFLLDRSNSMGAQGLGVIDRAASQLQSAVAQLTDTHQFQVIAYHHETVMIDQRALLDATPENKSKVSEFIHGLAAFGATEHENGLIAALAFRPDIVVMLSDGGLPEMNANQLATIQRMCGNQTKIHCLQFGSGPLQQERPFMQVLAEQNGGSYRYIDVNEWK